MNTLTTEIVNLLFNYDKETGEITHRNKDRIMFKSDHAWKISNAREGRNAATITAQGSMIVAVNQKQYTASRIIGLMHGIDMMNIGAVKFADNDKTNLRFDNLIFKHKGSILAKESECWCTTKKSTKNGFRVDFHGSFYVSNDYEKDAVMDRIKNAINAKS